MHKKIVTEFNLSDALTGDIRVIINRFIVVFGKPFYRI